MLAGALITGMIAGIIGGAVMFLTGAGLGWAFAAYVVVGIVTTLAVLGGGLFLSWGARLMTRADVSPADVRTSPKPLSIKRETP